MEITTTDFGAPIAGGPFDTMQGAKDWDASHPDSDGIYYEAVNDKWYCHGVKPGTVGPDVPLTTYN